MQTRPSRWDKIPEGIKKWRIMVAAGVDRRGIHHRVAVPVPSRPVVRRPVPLSHPNPARVFSVVRTRRSSVPIWICRPHTCSTLPMKKRNAEPGPLREPPQRGASEQRPAGAPFQRARFWALLRLFKSLRTQVCGFLGSSMENPSSFHPLLQVAVIPGCYWRFSTAVDVCATFWDWPIADDHRRLVKPIAGSPNSTNGTKRNLEIFAAISYGSVR